MTDADTKERNALRNVWPDIELLMCVYHFAKACSNHMNRTLGNGGGPEQKIYRSQMRNFMRHFHTRYLCPTLSSSLHAPYSFCSLFFSLWRHPTSFTRAHAWVLIYIPPFFARTLAAPRSSILSMKSRPSSQGLCAGYRYVYA